ncbi:MAG: GMC family oxidoreductase, partial [Pseudomonadales bacterium]
MELDERQVDRFGIPQVKFNFSYGKNEDKLINTMANEAAEMLTTMGGVNVTPYFHRGAPGDAIHGMGTARMGLDPKTSVLNAYNQAHDVANIFVTDGSCMTSSSCVNPSITYMALTARAADYAVKQYAEHKI